MNPNYMAEMGAALEKRIHQSYETRDDKGRRGILTSDLPRPFMKIRPGKHLLDLVPYRVGTHDPEVRTAGVPSYVLLLWAHMNQGVNGDNIICMMKNYGKPCGVCTEYARLREALGQLDDDMYKLYAASRRGLYYIICHDSPADEARGLLITEMSHWLFEKSLIAQAQLPGAAGGYVKFASLARTEGKQIWFELTGKGTGSKVEGLKFVDRTYDIPMEMFEEASKHPLDSLLVFPDYNETLAMVHDQTDRLIAGESAAAVKPQWEPGQQTNKPVTERQPPPREAAPGPVVHSNLCPHGFMFGTVYKHTECGACDVVVACAMELAKLQQMPASPPAGARVVHDPTPLPQPANPPASAGFASTEDDIPF